MGLVRKSAGASSWIGATFENQNGTIQVDSGTLSLAGGGTSSNALFNVNNGAQLVLTDGGAGESFKWNGTVTGSGEGTVLLDLSMKMLQLGAYDRATLAFPGSMLQWTSGMIECTSGTATNAGTITITGPAFKNLGGNLYNAGSLVITGAVVRIDSALHNLSAGTIDFPAGGSLTSPQNGSTINNAGLIRKSGGLSPFTVLPRLNNQNGTIQVDSGTLSLAAGGSSSNGLFHVNAGAQLVLTTNSGVGTSFNWEGTFTGSGGGTVLLDLSSPRALFLSDGTTLFFPGSMFQWTKGLIECSSHATNAGTITITGPASKLLSGGNLYNAGSLVITGATLQTSATLHNLPGGTIDFQTDTWLARDSYPSIYNAGLIRKSGGIGAVTFLPTFNNQNGNIEVHSGTMNLTSGNYAQGTGALTLALGGRGQGQAGKLNVTASAGLGGPLTVFLTNGFALATGERFQLLSCAARSGTFSSANLPQGTALEYTATGVDLVVTSALPVLLTSPAISNDVITISFNTFDGQSYTVQRNDEVDTTNWVFHTNFTGNGSLMQFVVPVNEAMQRFFRVRQP